MTDPHIETANANHSDFVGGAAPPVMGLQWASVGWDDKVEVVDLGATTNDGVTFVFVTTYAGRVPGDPPKPGLAQGHKYLAQLLGPSFRIPAKGERVLVGFPSGMETTTGAAVILGTLGSGPETKRNVAPGDYVISAGGVASLIIKANGGVSLFTTTDGTASGKLIALSIGPNGADIPGPYLAFDSPIGNFKFDASGFHLKVKAGPRLDMGGINIIGLPDAIANLFGAYAKITAPTIKLDGGSIFIGAGKIFNAALNALIKTAPGPAPPNQVVAFADVLQSQSVYIAP